MQFIGEHWAVTAAGTNAGATATTSAATARTHFVTSVSGHTDKDATIWIKDGTTIIWQTAIDISVEGFQVHSPAGLLIPITPGAACSAGISDSTSDCQVNFNGFSVPSATGA